MSAPAARGAAPEARGGQGCRLAARLLLLCGLGLAAPAQAYIYYTCRAADGSLSFNDAGCPADMVEVGTGTEAPALPPAPAPTPRRAAAPEPPPSAAAGGGGSIEAWPPALKPPAAIKPAIKPAAAPAAKAAGSAPKSAAPAAPRPPPQSAMPGPPEEPRPAYRSYFVLGIALLLCAWLAMLVQAFGRRAFGWGIALLLLSPPAMLAYGLAHWRRAGLILGGGVAGSALAAVLFVRPVDMIVVRDSYLTELPGLRVSVRPKPRLRFARDEAIYLTTVLDWKDPWVETVHAVEWQWLSGARARSAYRVRLRFGEPPYVLQGSLPARELGAGRHTVRVLVDGRVLDQREFDIRR